MDNAFLQIGGAVLAAAVALLAYMLREKNDKINKLEERVGQLEVARAVQLEINNNMKADLGEVKDTLKRIADKLGV